MHPYFSVYKRFVLIVAECNVNFNISSNSYTSIFVLIVAECNVNEIVGKGYKDFWNVLIVAECNVNMYAVRKADCDFRF